jgi:hypothetical protein
VEASTLRIHVNSVMLWRRDLVGALSTRVARPRAFHRGGDQAALADDAEQRHAVGIVRAAQEKLLSSQDETTKD